MTGYAVYLHNGIREYCYHGLDMRESLEYLGNLMNAMKGIKRTLYDIKDYNAYYTNKIKPIPYEYKFWLQEIYEIIDECLSLEESVWDSYFKYDDGQERFWKPRGSGADLTKDDSYVII